MPTAVTADNNLIHYKLLGHGPDLVMCHGFMLSLEAWAAYVPSLSKRFRVILIDARGHGESSKPIDPEFYKGTRRVLDVRCVLDAVNSSRATFWGYSMGARVGMECMCCIPERFDRYVLGGMHCFASLDGEYEERIALLDRGMKAYTSTRSIPLVCEPFLNQLSASALAAYCRAAAEQEDLSTALRECQKETLFYTGDNDPWRSKIEATAELVRGSELEVVSAAGHVDAFFSNGKVLAAVMPFLQKELI